MSCIKDRKYNFLLMQLTNPPNKNFSDTYIPPTLAKEFKKDPNVELLEPNAGLAGSNTTYPNYAYIIRIYYVKVSTVTRTLKIYRIM